MQMYTVRARLQTFEEQFVMSYGSLPLPSDRPAAVVEVTALPDRCTVPGTCTVLILHGWWTLQSDVS